MTDAVTRALLPAAQAEMNRLLAERPRWQPDLLVPRDADWSRTNSDWILENSAGGRDYDGAYQQRRARSQAKSQDTGG